MTPIMIETSLGTIKLVGWVMGPGSLIIALLVDFCVSYCRLMIFKHIHQTITHKPYIESRTEQNQSR